MKRNRKGATTVEFAIVCPVFLLFVFGLLEIGRFVMVKQLVEGGARIGARVAAMDGATTAEVERKVRESMPTISNPSVTVMNFRDPRGIELTTVTVTAAKFGWLAPILFGDKAAVTAVCSMRRETL
jgi:Flp pilus assembly protein TadG